MISFGIALHNPWPFSWGQDQHDVISRNWSLTRNKSLEIQLSWWARKTTLLSVSLDAPLRGRDHAGADLELDLLGLEFGLRLYDRRHWDHGTEDWQQQ